MRHRVLQPVGVGLDRKITELGTPHGPGAEQRTVGMSGLRLINAVCLVRGDLRSNGISESRRTGQRAGQLVT